MNIFHNEQDTVKNLNIPVLDWDTENLAAHFQKCFDFILEGMESGRVLVHWYQFQRRFFLSHLAESESAEVPQLSLPF